MSAIAEAIHAVYQEVGYVQRGGKMEHGERYTYAGEADLIGALRPAMVQHGLTCHVAGITDVTHENYQTSRGSTMNRVTLLATVRFAHTSGEYIDVVAAGEGSDVGDKATAKAMTGAYKYALRHTFCIETGDDPDKAPSADQERVQRPTPQRHKQFDPEDGKAAPIVREARKMAAEHGLPDPIDPPELSKTAPANAPDLSPPHPADQDDLPFEEPSAGSDIPSGGRHMDAKFGGECANCARDIAPGDPIYYHRGAKSAWCIHCAPEGVVA